MCRYNMSFNDAVMNEMRHHFKDEESLLVWLEVNMDHLMREYIARFKRPNIDATQRHSRKAGSKFLMGKSA